MALRAGAPAIGADFQNLELKTHAPLDSGTWTSTTYVTARSGATSPVGVSFTAPPSGKVTVLWAAQVAHSTTGSVLVAFQVKTGTTIASGSTIQGVTDSNALQNTGTPPLAYGIHDVVEGLDPGSDYNVSLMFRNGAAGTGTAADVRVSVLPAIA